MKLKLDENGHVVVQDGKPVYVHDDGKEVAYDAKHSTSTITRLNAEAQASREALNVATENLKKFEGIDDPEVARHALETVKNLSSGELKTKEQIEEIQREAKKAADAQVQAAMENGNRKLKEITTERDKYKNDYHNEKIGGAFAHSKYVSERIACPLDMLQSMFGGRFKLEDGKIVGHDSAGNKIFSRENPGNVADFDEAMETIVGAYPYRDQILKGTQSSGSGATQSRGQGQNGRQTMTRQAFEALAPHLRHEAVKTHEIVDA